MSIWPFTVLAVFMLAFIGAAILESWRRRIVQHAAVPEQNGAPPIGVTMIVPVRNGAGTIIPLLQDLYAQRYPKELCTTIVVDDGSTDATASLVQGFMRRWPQLRLLTAEGQGKKAAIAQAVDAAEGELILLTDADVRCGPERVAALVRQWSASRADMVLMPVHTEGGSTALGRLQEEEQNALQGATAGSALEGGAVLANGANLAFTRQAFHAVGGYAGDRWASGDDVFLLQRMRGARKRVDHLLAPEVTVTVQAEGSWKAFFAQRLRWAGKMRSFHALPGLLVGLFALLFPWLLFILTVLVLRHAQVGEGLFYTAVLLLAAWITWVFPIVRLAQAMRSFFAGAPVPAGSGVKRVPGLATLQTLLALLAFSIYAPICAVLSLFIRPRWKGRRI
jgi:poly-beta-1,6-N-acetyl-D-glucosamine synthase